MISFTTWRRWPFAISLALIAFGLGMAALSGAQLFNLLNR
jgi:hypothetical protein